MARVVVITGSERRRRWSDDQKQAIVAASFAPGAMVSEIARRAEVCPSQIYRWRQELGVAAPGFAQVLISAPEGSSVAAELPADAEPVIEVEYAGKVRVRIPGSIPADLAAAVVKALSRR